MSSDIFLFLSDEAFAPIKTATVIKYADINQTGVGMLDDNLLNYFVDHSLFLDPLSDGTNDRRKSRVLVDLESGLEPNGRMMLHFDADKVLNDGSKNFSPELISGFVVSHNDDAGVATAKRDRLGSLFNIIDAIFHARDREGNPCSKTAIESILLNTAESDSVYAGYVAGSLSLSTGKSEATTRFKSQGTPVSAKRFYWNSCKFKYSFVDMDNLTITITFNIWLNADEFKANYPFSTILDCIYPCNPTWIMNPTLYANQTRAILLSSNYKNEMLQKAVTERDHSGVMLLSSRYIAEYSDELPMTFALLYSGAMPTSDAARAFIREKLVAETDEEGHTWSEDEWKTRLPDLFIDGSYYLVPIYSSRVRLPDSTTSVEKSCINYHEIFEKAKAVLGGMGLDDVSLMSNIDILQAPGHSLYIVGIAADPINNPPLHELHPTYSSTDALSESFDAMSAGDKDFAEKLSQAMAICLQLTSGSNIFTDGSIGNRPAKVFAAGDIHENTNMEYIMLVYDKDDQLWS